VGAADLPSIGLPLRVGVVILPDRPWAQARVDWVRAEELGVAHAWTYDHLTWRSFRDQPWFGAVPTLTAAATVTERLRIGPLVASPNFRHPLTLAKELVTLDDLSGGRITLGIGAGGTGWDASMLAVNRPPWSPRERAERFGEFVELCDRLLREPAVSWTGRHYGVHEARTYPGCVQRPRVPFAVAASGPRGMALAARFGQTWVTTGPRDQAGSRLDARRGAGDPVPTDRGVAVVREQMRALDEACLAIGRDPATLDRLVLTGVPLADGLDSPDAFADTAGRYAEVGVTDLVVHWPRPEEPYAGDPAVLEAILT
jgi:alkanesulfonate monooxygenase SsuD/methylene tetrahydromethanopterin reductase-like flavin-dependent oxidoreductase (luciferase family)